jgi:protein required for attachment to host cells
MRHRGTLWVIAADGEHARIVARQARSEAFHTMITLDSPHAGERSAELGTDRPGRAFESASPARHAITPRQDLHEKAEREFLRSVAQRINQAAVLRQFDQLVLVAPSRAMPILRDTLSPQARLRLVATVRKDLTKVPDHEIAAHIGGVI